MTQPKYAKSGTPCYGAASDAVEIEQAGGIKAFKQGLHDAGYKAGYEGDTLLPFRNWMRG